MDESPRLDSSRRAYYSAPIADFCADTPDQILARLTRQHGFDLTGEQRDAWLEQVAVLKNVLSHLGGSIYLEFAIPRMGRRIDALAIIGPVIFIFEFKVGADSFRRQDLDQVVDYALDLSNFHEGSHGAHIAPVLVCTQAPDLQQVFPGRLSEDGVLDTTCVNSDGLAEAIARVLRLVHGRDIAVDRWEQSGYKPTPTIIEATLTLYREHSVADISRSDAGATNLSVTGRAVAEIIATARSRRQKAICLVTGVPGAGKTLVGLDAATRHQSATDDLYSVFLSGNGPLVAVLQEALARDKIPQAQARGEKLRKGAALSTVKAFIQNVHHFRDEYVRHSSRPPVEHVAIFDEAQRAWDLRQTADFMKRKKGIAGFSQSEPEFLISCLDRHPDWSVVIGLVGGGQEINKGEAGIGEWFRAIGRSFPHWKIYLSDKMTDSEYAAEDDMDRLRAQIEVVPELHLATSMRSFRSENVSRLVKELLDLDSRARNTLRLVGEHYPVVLTRDLAVARTWLRQKARGSERYGIVVSSQAERLKPHALDVRSPVDPVNWFLNDRDDVRSSYYLEDVATEFHVQGLELDWSCVVWDADFRFSPGGWQHWSFRGSKWEHIHARDRQQYLKNAYRVLLTRARQGMVLVVPPGDRGDPTRDPEFYDQTYEYLSKLGMAMI